MKALSEIGRILRTFREKTSRHLSEVAQGAGISTSMLSQIERGLVSPSIETLLSVCGALGLEPRELFGRLSTVSPVRIVAPANRLRSQERGILYEQLIASPDPAHHAEMFILQVEPGCDVGLSGKGHEGVEMGYVLSGKAKLAVDGAEYALNNGDSVAFRSHLPHRLTNDGQEVFRAVWTVLPPHHDYLDAGTAQLMAAATRE